jgi:hypothetical protein
MSLISNIVNFLNTEIFKPAIKVSSSSYYGLTQSVKYKNNIIPAVANPLKKTEFKGIVIDDRIDFLLYHKLNTVISGLSPSRGYGDQQADKTTTYQNSIIIYQNSLKTGLAAEDMYLFIQSLIPYKINNPDVKKILLAVTGGTLNSATVFNQEYPDAEKNPVSFGKTMIQINYTLEATINPACFATCSDDLKIFKN